MRLRNRKTTPKVVGGLVLRKNNHKKTPNYWNTSQKEVIVDVEKPGKGYKHFLKKRDVLKFLQLIPNWGEVSTDLDAIVLISGVTANCDGYYNNNGVICISAWEIEQDILVSKQYYEEHKELFERLGIKSKKEGDNYFCEFNDDQIKGYQLLHILLHEIGHHIDRLRTKTKKRSARGEKYAEDYAFEYEEKIWSKYQDVFNVIF